MWVRETAGVVILGVGARTKGTPLPELFLTKNAVFTT